jgi:MOSC domain-containing protein YiiM
MVTVEAARLVTGAGIIGDDKAGLPIPGSNITLIAAEAIEAMVMESGIALAPGETRRNVVTRGVDLDALVGRRFRVGTAICLGVKPCNPCNHLEEVTRPGVRAGLGGRGGLRADVVSDGLVHPGDTIEILAEGAPAAAG